MIHFFAFLGGLFIGSLITNIIYLAKRASGTLRIDHTNPERDVYRIEINDLDKLSKKTQVILKVDNHADLSQK